MGARRSADDQESEGAEEVIGDLLRAWRRRSTRRVPGVQARGPGLTQEGVARLGGFSTRWYGKLERGEGDGEPEEDLLEKAARVLDLSEVERRVLFLMAAGHLPPPSLPTVMPAEADDHIRRFLEHQEPAPAYVSDLAWNILAWNGAAESWFPWLSERPSPNLMRWAILDPRARRQLLRWREDWVRPYLAQIRYARVIRPDHLGLKELQRDILRGSADARSIWKEREVRAESDGVMRRLRLPHLERPEVSVVVVAVAPLGRPDLRVVVLLDAEEV